MINNRIENLSKTKIISVGNVKIGGNEKIVIQSMTNTKTSSIKETIAQANELFSNGCDIVRLAVLDDNDADALKEITKNVLGPIVADIHFDYKLALKAIDNGVKKIRINPGNIENKEHIMLIVNKCIEKNIPIRIGINSGSIAHHIYEKYGNSYMALVESAKENVKMLEEFNFNNIIISVKSSDVYKTVKAYELLSKQFSYPLHLGVTEAGLEYTGLVKSSIAIGALLLRGIGDTIRVSLTTSPLLEVKAAKEILSSLGLYQKPLLISCPTCGRCQYNMIPIANEINEFINTFEGNIKIAIMGCVVNGPGEAKDADLGIAGGKDCAVLFKKGEIIAKLNSKDIINNLKAEIYLMVNNYTYEYDKYLIIKKNNQIIYTFDDETSKYINIIKNRYNIN